jgi:carbamoyl-phosphate synthase large subunit
MSPKVLIAQANDWLVAVRLPFAFKSAGAEVAVACPREHALLRSRFIDQRFPMAPLALRSIIRRCTGVLRGIAPRTVTAITRRFRPLADLVAHPPESSANLEANLLSVIRRWRPDFVVAGDEITRHAIHKFVSGGIPHQSLTPELLAMLRRSVGDARHFEAVEQKSRLLELARECGVRVAPSKNVRVASEAVSAASEIGYPVVIKRDFTSGGVGALICREPEQIAAGMDKLSGLSPSDYNHAHAILSSRDGPDEVRYIVEKYLPGYDANYALVALDGKVLAGVGARVIQSRAEMQPASVVSIGVFPELAEIAEKLVRILRYSGFAGCDFRISAEDELPYLLELNPRPVPTSHLGRHVGRDLCAALVDALDGRAGTRSSAEGKETLIALFPHEWNRDPASDWLRRAYYDVPRDEPKLVRYLQSPAFLARNGVGSPAPATASAHRKKRYDRAKQ